MNNRIIIQIITKEETYNIRQIRLNKIIKTKEDNTKKNTIIKQYKTK